jgi:outer membrane lipoprotein SlyB
VIARTSALLAVLLLTASPALAKGCIRGAAAGGVAGHFVGKGHAVAGAAAGCVVAHHHYAKQAKQQKVAARQAH